MRSVLSIITTLFAILLLTTLPVCGGSDDGDPNEGEAEGEELCEEICDGMSQCMVASGDNRDTTEIYAGCMYNCTRDPRGCGGSCSGAASACNRARQPFPYATTVDNDQCGEVCECYDECRE